MEHLEQRVVLNADPLPENDFILTGVDQSIQFSESDLTTNDFDPEGDPLSVEAIFGRPQHGSLTWNANGTITFTPDAGFHGFETHQYLVSDGHGHEARATFTISVNNAPAATNDSFDAVQNTPLTISIASLLGNDSDPNGDPLSLLSFGPPAHGTLLNNYDGTLTYTPEFDYTGDDSFTYLVDDGFGAATEATVNILVDAVPVAEDDTYEMQQGDSLVIHLLENDHDPDGDALNLTGFTSASHGYVINNGDGTVTYTPYSYYFGPDSFTYTVDDGRGGYAAATVNITVNGRPALTNNEYEVLQDVPLTISAADLLLDDSDPDGDPLTLIGFTQPVNGTVIENENGTLTYMPNGEFWGTDTFTYTVDDGRGGQETATVTLNVNGLPKAYDDAYDAAEATPRLIDSANGLLANDSDPQWDGLTIVPETKTTPQGGSVTLNDNGSFTYQSASGFSGIDTFTYTVDDGRGGHATAMVTMNVLPLPTAAPDGTYEFLQGTSLQLSIALDLLINDGPDQMRLTVVGFDSRGYGAIVNYGDTVIFTPDSGFSGSGYFTYTVDDGFGNLTTGDVNFYVNALPTLTDDTYTTSQGTLLNVDVTNGLLANDSDPDDLVLTVDETTFTTANGGEVSIAYGGSFTYLPALSFSGTDTFTYTVDDGRGGRATATVTLNVNGLPAPEGDEYAAVQDVPLIINVADLLSNDTDQEGDPLSLASFTQPNNGTLVDNYDGTLTYTPNLGHVGDDSFTYTVDDGHGGQSTATVSIVVDAAIAGSIDFAAENPTSALVGEFVSLTISTGALDPATLNLAWSVTDANGVMVTSGTTAYIDFVPTTAGSYAIAVSASSIANPANTVTVNGGIDIEEEVDGSVSFSGETGNRGVIGQNFSLSILTGTLDPSKVSIAWSVVTPGGTEIAAGNSADVGFTPMVGGTYGISATVTSNALPGNTTSVSGSVLVNTPPTDSDSSDYSTEEDKALTADLPVGQDADSDSFEYYKASDPSSGTLTISLDGEFTYTPNPDFNGTDSFSYYLNDGFDTSAIYTITITVTPADDDPMAQDGTLTTDEDTPGNGTLVATDPNGDPLTYSVGTASNGTVTLTNPSTGDYTYTPNLNFNGTDSFTFTASDGTHTSNTATVTITVTAVNDPPTGSDKNDYVTDEDVPLTAHVPDGEDVDFDTLEYVKFSDPSSGTVELSAGGEFTYTPNLDFNGTDSFTYKVFDGTDYSPAYTITITVNPMDDDPVAQDGTLTTSEDTSADGTLVATDPNGDPLTYSVGTASNGTVTLIDASTGDYTYTPNKDFYGTDSFTFTASDGRHTSNVATVTITVTAVAPAAPTNFTAMPTVGSETTSLDLSWTDNADDENGYEVRGSDTTDIDAASGVADLAADATSTTDSGLAPETTKYYWVAAYKLVDGERLYSDWASTTGTTNALPQVSVAATNPTTTEGDTEEEKWGKFTFSRSGGDQEQPLTVYFYTDGTVADTATLQDDYDLDTPVDEYEIFSIVIPAEQASADVYVKAKNDAENELDEEVTIKILADSPQPWETKYKVNGEGGTATVTIKDRSLDLDIDVNNDGIVDEGDDASEESPGRIVYQGDTDIKLYIRPFKVGAGTLTIHYVFDDETPLIQLYNFPGQLDPVNNGDEVGPDSELYIDVLSNGLGPQTIRLRYTPADGGQPIEDTVVVVVQSPVDLDTDTDGDGTIDEEDDSIEAISPGKILDMMAASATKVEVGPRHLADGETLTLHFDPTILRFFHDEACTSEISNGGEVNVGPIYVLGVGGGSCDVVLRHNIPNEDATETDICKFTVYGIDIIIDDVGEDFEDGEDGDFQPGAYVRVNNDFSKFLVDGEGQRIADNSDEGADVLDEEYERDLTPATVRVYGDVTSQSVVFTFSDEIAVWDVTPSIGGIIPRRLVSGETLLIPITQEFNLLIEAISDSPGHSVGVNSIDVDLMAPATEGTAMPIVSDSAHYTVIDTSAAFDGDRSNTIDFTSFDDHRMLFWYNDDRDGVDDDGLLTEIRTEGDADSEDNQIANIRDLEDFAPLHVRLDESIRYIFASLYGRDARLGFRLVTTDGESTEAALRLFQAPESSTSSASDYTRNPTIEYNTQNPLSLITGSGVRVGSEMVYLDLSPSMFDGTWGHALPNGYDIPFIFEAIAPPDGRSQALMLEVFVELPGPDDSISLARIDEIGIHLKSINLFVDEYTIDASSQLNDVEFDDFDDQFLPDATQTGVSMVNGYPGHNSTDTIVLVHGWNMPDFWKDAFAHTMYKRMFWQGFTGRFVIFNWPTLVDEDGPLFPEYDARFLNQTFRPSEYEALRSGRALMNLLSSLNGSGNNVTLLAHSQGNVVAASAMRLWAQDHPNEALVQNYVAMQAAISAGAYGSDTEGAHDVPELPNILLPEDRDYWRYTSNGVVDPNSEYFMYGTEQAAGKWINFYNSEDYATSWLWPMNNARPLEIARPEAVWQYWYTAEAVDEINGLHSLPGSPYVLYRNSSVIDSNPAYLDDPDTQLFEIMAFHGAANAMPVGTMAMETTGNRNWSDVDLHALFSSYDPTARPQHSFEFHHSSGYTSAFYHEVMVQAGITSSLMPPA